MNNSPPLSPFLRALHRLRAAFWRRRLLRWLVRAAWLSLLAPTIALAGYLWLGWAVAWYHWLFPMLLVALISLLWAIRPLPLLQVAGQLDNRLRLQARLTTAQEVDNPATASNPVVQQLLLETVNIVIGLRRSIHSLDRGFWLEVQTLLGVATLLVALLLLDVLTPILPHAPAIALPAAWQEPRAEAIIPPNPQLLPPPFQPDIQAQQIQNKEAVQQALDTLADALRDQAATRAIAEALDRGDLAGAAAELRRLADQLGNLSDEARNQLGHALQEAANNAPSNTPEITEPLQAGEQALGTDNLSAAQQALEALANALEALAQRPQESAQTQPGDPASQPGATSNVENQAQAPTVEPAGQLGQSTGAGEGAGAEGNQPSEDERLALEGQPLELKSEGQTGEPVVQPAQPDAQPGNQTTAASPFGRLPANAAADDLGPDPLTYPWSKREVIRKYFTP